MITRRTWLKGVTAGAGSVVLSPLIRSLAAQVAGTYTPPKRFLFVLTDNGFYEDSAQPVGVPLEGDLRQLPLGPLTLSKDIDPFTPYKDRLLIVQGLRARHLHPDHGAGFGALSGVTSPGSAKFSVAAAESIDAAIARVRPAIFPLLVLGIAPGSPSISAFYASSAWGPGRAIAAQCRPELAYESLFGSTGADRNDFLSRKNLLDFIAGDVKRLRPQLGGPEREQLDYQLRALEALSRREGQLGALKDEGKLKADGLKLPPTPPELMPEVLSAQFDIAAAALTTGLTNVVTITSGLCRIMGTYKGFTNGGAHATGHGEGDPELGMTGKQILAMIRRFIAERIVGLMKKLQETPEGGGSMLDNTVVVFMSDSGNRQHSHGENWPMVVFGNPAGGLKTGRLVAYPLKAGRQGDDYANVASARDSNPTLNAMYCTLLHVAGDPREHFNLSGANREIDRPGPLKELLT
ncbi:MAG: DUF1552 domain-containing protein [Planctomycetota bacterium]|nr:MAG: DUF1552 domain-containing protein [Planctomycetota bacterium]